MTKKIVLFCVVTVFIFVTFIFSACHSGSLKNNLARNKVYWHISKTDSALISFDTSQSKWICNLINFGENNKRDTFWFAEDSSIKINASHDSLSLDFAKSFPLSGFKRDSFYIGTNLPSSFTIKKTGGDIIFFASSEVVKNKTADSSSSKSSSSGKKKKKKKKKTEKQYGINDNSVFVSIKTVDDKKFLFVYHK